MKKGLRTAWPTVCIGVGVGAAACAALQPQGEVPAIPILEVALHAEKYKDQVIRTCGPIYQQRFQSTPKVWELIQPAAVGYHPATVLVIRRPAPQPTTEGRCVTGRVAALNGSLRKPELEVFSSAPLSEPWYIHEQCPANAARH